MSFTRFLTCGDYPVLGSGVYSRRWSGQAVAPYPMRESRMLREPRPQGAKAIDCPYRRSTELSRSIVPCAMISRIL